MAKNFNVWPDQWPKSLNYPEQPVFSFLDQSAARVPNRVAIIFGGMELTFAELKDLSDRFANALISMGFKKGDYYQRYPYHIITNSFPELLGFYFINYNKFSIIT